MLFFYYFVYFFSPSSLAVTPFVVVAPSIALLVYSRAVKAERTASERTRPTAFIVVRAARAVITLVRTPSTPQRTIKLNASAISLTVFLSLTLSGSITRFLFYIYFYSGCIEHELSSLTAGPAE